MTAIILAGGKALRMGGVDKAFLEINNGSIILEQLRTLKKIFKKIIIVTNSPARYENLDGTILISDVILSRGPLCGIYSGLLASSSFYNFVVACDMPFLNEALIRYMVKNKGNYDAIVPEIDGRLHPLFGVYSKNCIPVMKELIEKGELRVLNVFSKVNSRFLPRQDMEKIDERLLSLVNINTVEDLATAGWTREDL